MDTNTITLFVLGVVTIVLTTTIVSIIELRIKLKSYSVSLEELEKFFKRKADSFSDKFTNNRKFWEENFNKLSKHFSERLDLLGKDVHMKHDDACTRVNKEAILGRENTEAVSNGLRNEINDLRNQTNNVRNELHQSAHRLDERVNHTTNESNGKYDALRGEFIENLKTMNQKVDYLFQSLGEINQKLDELKKLPNNENIQKGKRRAN